MALTDIDLQPLKFLLYSPAEYVGEYKAFSQKVEERERVSIPKLDENATGLAFCRILLAEFIPRVRKTVNDPTKMSLDSWFSLQSEGKILLDTNSAKNSFGDTIELKKLDAYGVGDTSAIRALADNVISLLCSIAKPSGKQYILVALGLLLAFDKSESAKRWRRLGQAPKTIEQIGDVAKKLNVSVDKSRQELSVADCEAILALYATTVCGSKLEKKEPCQHCAGQRVKNKPCPHCGIIGDSWTCPSCRTKTAVADIPKHGTSGMYCPSCGIPVVHAREFVEKLNNALRISPDDELKKLKDIQSEYHAAVGNDVSWEKLNALVEQLTAATTALKKIDSAIQGNNLPTAEALLKSAKRKFPDLDYSQFESRIADLRREEERRERQKRELAAANAAIQSLLDACEFSKAQNKVKETERLDLADFDAEGWRRKIESAKAEAERKRKEREERERGQKIASLKTAFDAACKVAEWEKAEGFKGQLVSLGDRSCDWDIEINRRKESFKADREKDRKNALAAFNTALGRCDIKLAEAKLAEAKEAERVLREKCGIRTTSAEIKDAETILAKKRLDQIIENLPKVQSLTASGSTDGKPTITISWEPGIGGTPVAKWRLMRRTGDGRGGVKSFPDIDSALCAFKDQSADLQFGVEYVYEITPLAETGKNRFAPNEKAAVRSAPTVCLAKLAADALTGRGEGEAGQWGLVALSWRLPAGLESREGNVKLKLSRSDGRFRDKDVTGRVGFEDNAVEVGRSYEYTLDLSIAGQASGRSAARVAVATQPPPEAVRELRARRLPGGRSFSGGSTWLATWDWPAGGDRVLLVQSEGALANPGRPALASDAQVVEKGDYEKRQGAEVFVRRGMRRLTAYSFKEMAGGRRKYAAGTWTGVTTETAEIGVEIVTHRVGLFRRAADTEVFVSSSTGELPALAVVAGNGRSPQRMADGRKLAELPAGPMGAGGKVRIAVPGDVPPETIRVFLADPVGDAERFRLAPARIQG